MSKKTYGSSPAATAEQPAAAAVVPSPPPTVEVTKALTIFYNGSVATFHLTQDKAEDVMNMAAGRGEQVDDAAADGTAGRRQLAAAAAEISISASSSGDQLLEKLKRELPIANKRSLVRFFQKRKERLYRP
ncbi:protein TIFY 9 [Oryza brachyantha]|uniref:protein TIFY 9 n=1 Tax=Oryza brachyantha TaxID=4533 RepID=UPI001AD95AE9|nr:protein TIFY 9 [Oryza brachyantha]